MTIPLIALLSLLYLGAVAIVCHAACRISPREARRLRRRDLALRGQSGYEPRDRSR